MQKVIIVTIILFMSAILMACSPPAQETGSELAGGEMAGALASDLPADLSAKASLTPVPTAARLATAIPTTAPTATVDATQTADAAASPTPHPLQAYTIPGLQQQAFPGGTVQIRQLLEENEAYSRYYVAYPSGDLRITGTMHVPKGEGIFPVLILLHGYYERDDYYAGADTWQAADFFAREGYLVLAPDLRSWGESDPGLSLFHTGLVADVMNLISSLPSIAEADPARVGLWGHSMGGGMATKILTIDERVDAAVLYAPNSADDADLIARWGPGCLPGQSEAAGDNCNPGEFIPADTPAALIEAYLAATSDPGFLARVAPINYLDQISVPVQIHIGEADGSLRTHTPPEWSDKLFAALQEAGVPVAFYSYPGQGHYFTDPAWTEMLARSVTLFDAVLQTGAPNE